MLSEPPIVHPPSRLGGSSYSGALCRTERHIPLGRRLSRRAERL
jgi:hypothetical protein